MGKKILVIIDCGHCLSGSDTGASGLGYREEVLTREVGNSLANILTKAGTEYVFVHPDSSSSVNSSLRARVDKANRYGYAIIYVSIHFNSFGNGSANGAEVLISARGGKAEQFAKNIQAKLVNEAGLYNRGVKVNANLYVLRNTNMPAVLVECGFISNRGDMNKYNPNKYAECIAEGILGYEVDVENKPVDTPQKPTENKIRYFTTYNVDSSLTIRERGTTDARAIGSIPSGAKFKFKWVDSSYLGWLYIDYNGTTGYVCAKYTKEIKEVEQPKEKWGVVTANTLNVRDGAGEGYKVIGSVFHNEKVRIVWTEPGWHYIEYNTSKGKKRGYVSAKYIK